MQRVANADHIHSLKPILYTSEWLSECLYKVYMLMSVSSIEIILDIQHILVFFSFTHNLNGYTFISNHFNFIFVDG